MMPVSEKVFKALECCKRKDGNECRVCPYTESEYCTEEMVTDALELLKEQEAEKKRILKIIWDTLHEGLSIDTVPDQDWVYERIRNRIEGTYDET